MSYLSLNSYWPFKALQDKCVITCTTFKDFTPDHKDWLYLGISAPSGRSVKRKAEFYAGRACARQALQILQPNQTARLNKHPEHGFVLWPTGSCGAITHSQGFAAAIVAPLTSFQGIGLDAEAYLAVTKALRLAPHILTANEQRVLDQLSPVEQALFVTQVFSIKESLYKALYPLSLVFFGFQAAEVVINPQQPLIISAIKLLINLDSRWQAGHEFLCECVLLEQHVLSLVRVPT